MKKVRLMTGAALFAIAGLSFGLTSCEKDDVACAVGLEGKNCKDEVREKYYNTYRGNGSDDHNYTYTDWAVQFSSNGSDDVREMAFRLMDENDVTQVNSTARLKTNTTFELKPYVANNGFEYSGEGSVNENSASLTLREEDEDLLIIYTFNNMSR